MKKTFLWISFLLIALSGFTHDKRSALEFVENKSQWNTNVLFKGILPHGASVYLERDGFKFAFLDAEEFSKLHDLQFASREEQLAFTVPGHAWKMNFVEADLPEVLGEKKKSYYHNYFLGNDESRWAGQVGVYERVEYSQLWEGVDLKVHARESNFKYDFIVRPGADPDLIRLSFDGLEMVSLRDGQIVLQTSIGEFYESEPFAYQLFGSELVEVPCEYFMNEKGEITYIFPEGYDESKKLVIDPELIASTLSGTTGFESNYGHSAAFDIEENIYTGCVAAGSEYPVNTGAFQQAYGGGSWDIAVSKLNPDGTDLIWATYIGGSGTDYPHSLVTDNNMELFVYGSSSSDNYPTTGNAIQTEHADGGGFAFDIVVTHLAFDGSALEGSTYLGGTGDDGENTIDVNYGDEYRGEIIIDYDNNPIIASGSESNDFPVTANSYQSTNAGEQDAVLVKMNANLSTLLYSTYLGGTGDDMGYTVKTSADGFIYMAGGAGEDFPVTPDAYQTGFLDGDGGFNYGPTDGFIARFDSEAESLLNCTYFGTDAQDQVFFMNLDFEEDIWVYGQGGGDMPVTEGVYSNPDSRLFVSKFSKDLTTLETSTTIGSGNSGLHAPVAFLVDNCDNIYISAYNANFGSLEVTEDALFDSGGFYVGVYEEDLTDITFGTYYTGAHVDGGTSRFDKNGIVYQGVCSGGGFSTTPDAWATNQSTGWDVGVFKIDFDAQGVNAAIAGNDISGCAPFEISFQNFSVGDQFIWDFGDGTISTEYEPTIVYDEPGSYDVSLIASDSLSCNLADTVQFVVNVSTPEDFDPSFEFDFDCVDQIIETTNTTGLDFLEYVWDMGDGTVLESTDAVHQYEEPGSYTVSLLAIDNGCEMDEEISQEVELLPSVEAAIESDEIEGCGELEINFESLSENAEDISWDFDNGTSSSNENATITFNGPAQFNVLLTANNPNTCNGSDTDSLLITVSDNEVIEALFDVIQTDCEEYLVETSNTSLGDFLNFEWDMGDGSTYTEENVIHNYDGTGIYNITLNAEDEICDLSDSFSQDIEITDEVLAAIANGDLSDCGPFTVDFESASVGASELNWDFGDGSPIQTGESVSYTYESFGEFTVTLTVEGDGGCTGEDAVTSTVEVIEPPVLSPDFTYITTGQCDDLSVLLTNTSEGTFDNVEWNLGDGTLSELSDEVEHSYENEGVYPVTITISEDFCGNVASIELPVEVEDHREVELGIDEPFCYYDEEAQISAGLSGDDVTYLWSTDETTQSITVNETGSYSVVVTKNGCTFTDEINVNEIPELNIFTTEQLCNGINNTIEAPYPAGSSFFWSTTEEIGRFINPQESGVYNFSFTDQDGCYQEGSVAVELLENEPIVYIPNAFTPNGDGINDVFKPSNTNLDEYNFTVFNRWGEVVFDTENPNEYWLGEFEGGSETDKHYVQNSLYTYKITYSSYCNSETIEKTGHVTVIR